MFTSWIKLWLWFSTPGIAEGSGTTSWGIVREGRDTNSGKRVSQEQVDKIIYDIMSSDKGLAALASGENVSGGYGSSAKGLLAQDLTAKIAGEIAAITAESYAHETSKKKSKTDTISAKGGSVICTELTRQGLLNRELYEAGQKHFLSLHPQTVRGYQVWAKPIAAKMQMSKSSWLTKLTLPIARKRYEYIVLEKFTITGWLTVYFAEPVCYIIGLFVSPFSGITEFSDGAI